MGSEDNCLHFCPGKFSPHHDSASVQHNGVFLNHRGITTFECFNYCFTSQRSKESDRTRYFVFISTSISINTGQNIHIKSAQNFHQILFHYCYQFYHNITAHAIIIFLSVSKVHSLESGRSKFALSSTHRS